MNEPVVPLVDLRPEVASELSLRGARQLNLYRALSSSPDVVRAWFAFIWSLRDDCRTPRALRELMILRTAVRHASRYEWAHHAVMAHAAGATDSQIDAVKRWPGSADEFGQEERLALELADAICDGEVPDALVAASLESFGAQGHVELVVTAAAYVMVPRVLDGLRVPLEEVMNTDEGH